MHFFSNDASIVPTTTTKNGQHHSLSRVEKKSEEIRRDFNENLSKESSDVPIPIHVHSTKKTNYVNIEEKDAPILMPKQHKPMTKAALMKKRTDDSEHYQLPPKETIDVKQNDDEDDDYRPPLPPKQRHQHETSRALVYDFIGSELQELRATLAQFEKISSSSFLFPFFNGKTFLLSSSLDA